MQVTASTNLRVYQSCRSNEGWQIIRIPSDSQEKVVYSVHVSPWKATESICECPGYMFRGHCKHLQIAEDRLCRWSEVNPVFAGKLHQTDEQTENKVCPRCDGPTKWEVEVVE